MPHWLEELEQDVRVALRRLRRAPGLAIAIVSTLGLGLGAAAAIFTAAEAAFFKPLPYTHSERLAEVSEMRVGTRDRTPTSFPTLEAWRARLTTFSALEGYDPANFAVGIGTDAQMRRGAEVTRGFFQLLGVRAASGRLFSGGSGADGAGVAVVSARLARPVGPIALGGTIRVNGRTYVVIGVLPVAFQFAQLQDADVFIPLLLDRYRRADQFNRSIHVVGRYRDGVTLAAARAELAAVMSQLASEHPDALEGRTAVAVSLRDASLGNVRPILAILLLAVVLVLVSMATNLALLMMARYAERAPELHMRLVLGATRLRVLRHLFVESLIPGALGAVLAVLIGHLGTRALLGVIPASTLVGMPYLATADIDARIVAVLVTLTLVLVVAFGVLPAMTATRARVSSAHGRATLSRADRRVRRALVVIQLALTVVLLACTGLLVRSFGNLVNRELGFTDPATLVVASAPLSGPRYDSASVQSRYYETLLSRSIALPGVRRAALVNEGPGGGGGVTSFAPIDVAQRDAAQSRALLRIVGGAYFATLGVPLREGRVFDSRDRSTSPPVVVVSAGLAKLLAQTGPVIGRRLRLARGDTASREVVGVVGDVQATALDAAPIPVVYVSHLQVPENHMMLVLRTQLSVGTVRKEVRAIVQDLDVNIPVYGVGRLDEQLNDSWAVLSRRFPMILCGAFGVAALLLALVAMYAICAHEVTLRHREFGIRIALGAAPAAIYEMVLVSAVRVGSVGIAAGVLVALVAAQSLRALLFEVAPADWAIYAAAAAVVMVSSVFAAIGPAMRGRATDPALVMRQE